MKVMAILVLILRVSCFLSCKLVRTYSDTPGVSESLKTGWFLGDLKESQQVEKEFELKCPSG